MPLTVDLLATDERLGSHELVDLLDNVRSERREDPETPQKLYNLLQFPFLFLANDPDVVLAMEGSEAALGGTLDCGSSTIVFEEGKLAE